MWNFLPNLHCNELSNLGIMEKDEGMVNGENDTEGKRGER
jgi:hypothetical protein